MPMLVATLTPTPATTLNGTVAWQALFDYDSAGPDDWSYKIKQSVAASTPWNISSAMMPDIAGGTTTVSYAYGNYTGSFTFNVLGQNPSPGSVNNLLGTTPWFLQQLVNHESGDQQFNSNGTPNFGPPNGFGVMQLDPPPSVDDIWNWTQNVNDGVSLLNQDGSWASSFWNSQVTAWTNFNNTPGISQVAQPSDTQEGPCTFSYSPQNGEHPYSDALWIKSYNSGANNDPYIYFNQFKNQDGQQQGLWIIKPQNNYSPPFDYVQQVCSTSP